MDQKRTLLTALQPNLAIPFPVTLLSGFWLIILSSILVLTAGCQSTRPATHQELHSQPAEAINPRVTELLALADQAMAKNHLTTPLENNAYLRYLQVLAIDDENDAANQGISDIAEKYLAWAIQNTYRGHYRQATDYLNKARSVDENHPNIATVEKMIEGYKRKTRQTFELPRPPIETRDYLMVLRLEAIAGEISTRQATVQIEAPTDQIGRWIYQQLNESTPTRVRATFAISNHVRIHLSY